MEKTNVVKLVERTSDARHWTPEESLVETLEKIRSGKINPKYMAIHWIDVDNDKEQHRYSWAGGKLEEHIALLSVGQQRLSDYWK